MGGRDTSGGMCRGAVAAVVVLAALLVTAEAVAALVWLGARHGPPRPVRGEALPLRVEGDPQETPWLALAVRKHAPRRVEVLVHLSFDGSARDADAGARVLPRAVRETMLRRTLDAAWVAANDLVGTPVRTYVHALVARNPVIDWYTMIVAVDGDDTDVPAALRRAERRGRETLVTLTVETPLGRTQTRTLAIGELGRLDSLAPWRVPLTPPPRLDLPSRIRGGSIGLVAALLHVDRLTPGDLAGGAVVAASGTIDPSGEVGRVASLPWKLDAAAAAGAAIVLVPEANGADVDAEARGDLRTVDTLAGAVGVLCAEGGRSACEVIGAAPA